MMTKNLTRPLGILRLERGPAADVAPTPLPWFLDAGTFDFPFISETVAGGFIETVVRGDPALEGPFVEAAKRLVDRGAAAITCTCGFSVRHQKAIAAAVDVPVVMSSLLVLPTLLRQSPATSKVAVMTYDSTHCTEDLLAIDSPEDRRRIVIGGIEGGQFWHDELKRPPPPLNAATIEKDVIACINRLRETHPEIATILFECGAFPAVAPTVRALTKLPVYDITDVCRLTMASVL